MKQNSQLMAMQASLLEHQAMSLKHAEHDVHHSPHIEHVVNIGNVVHHDESKHNSSKSKESPKYNQETLVSLQPASLGDVMVQKVSTGYPVYNLPKVQHVESHPTLTDFVRPLPPSVGPNPYEVLTSAFLGRDYPGVSQDNGGGVNGGVADMGGKTVKPIKVVISLKDGINKKKYNNIIKRTKVKNHAQRIILKKKKNIKQDNRGHTTHRRRHKRHKRKRRKSLKRNN